MLSEELTKLVQEITASRCEGQHIELKRAAKGAPEKLYDTLSSFSNQNGGGVIVFGIDEDAGFEVAGVYDAQDLQAKVAAQAQQMEPAVRPVFTVARVGGRTVVSAEVPECDMMQRPCFYRGAGRLRGSYIRVGEADMPMTEYEVYSYEAFREKTDDELRHIARADASALDADATAEYLIKLRRAKPNLARQDDGRILQLQGLAENGRPTLAGLLVLGEYPQAFLPQLSVTAMRVAGRRVGELGGGGERFVDNQRIEGRLDQMLDGTISFVRRNMRTSTIVDASGKRADVAEYPVAAVRELVLNALVHRDYSAYTDHSPVRVVMYDDRLEVESPGGLYGRTAIEDLGKAPADTRNPFLAGCMEVLAATENRFSGIPTIMAEMERAGLPPAEFASRRGTFTATLRNGRATGGSGGLPPAGTAPASAGAPLSGRQQAILAFCSQPRSRAEIAAHLGINTASYVSTKLIRPLLDAGLLRMTIPDAPKSKNQRYISVAQ